MLFEMLLIVLRGKVSVGRHLQYQRQQGYVRRACHLARVAASWRSDLMSVILHQQMIVSGHWYDTVEVTPTGVEDDGDLVARSDIPDKMRGGNSASNRGLLFIILDTFATEICRASLAHL